MWLILCSKRSSTNLSTSNIKQCLIHIHTESFPGFKGHLNDACEQHKRLSDQKGCENLVSLRHPTFVISPSLPFNVQSVPLIHRRSGLQLPIPNLLSFSIIILLLIYFIFVLEYVSMLSKMVFCIRLQPEHVVIGVGCCAEVSGMYVYRSSVWVFVLCFRWYVYIFLFVFDVETELEK